MSSLSETDVKRALFEIRITFITLTGEQWGMIEEDIWKDLKKDLSNMSGWVKAKLYAIPDTGKFWKARLHSHED
jgi:hypothetical protein